MYEELTRLENLMFRMELAVKTGQKQTPAMGETATIEQRAEEQGFDIGAARTSGYTDAEIEEFLK